MSTIDRAAIAAALASFSGLNYQVAFNWLSAENSSYPTNPLGILCGNSAGSGLEIGCTGRFAMYRSATDGVKAAAWLVAHGPYSGIRSAISGGSPAQQRAAIVSSPWAAGNYNNGAGFATAGITTAPSPSATPAPFIDIPEGKILDGNDVKHISDLYAKAGILDYSPGGLIAAVKLQGILTEYIGQPWNAATRGAIQAQIGGSGAAAGSLGTDVVGAAGNAAGAAAGAVGSALFGNFAWVPGLAVSAGILALILVLGYKGVTEVLG